jgi:broad specificity phosphatase PhoE
METLEKVQERSLKALQNLQIKFNSERIAIVTHRAVLKPLFAGMLNIPVPYFWKIHIDTAAYCIAEYRPQRGYTFTLINEFKHLQDYIREDLG